MASQNPWKSNNKSSNYRKEKNKERPKGNMASTANTVTTSVVPKKQISKKNVHQNALNDGMKKFEEIHHKNVEKAKAYATENYESSSDEEELNSNELIGEIFKGYTAESNQLAKIQDLLENFLQSGSIACLICIGSIKRNAKIWSCKNCYCFFHLDCIKRWGNDSIAQQKMHENDNQHGYYNNLGEFIPPKKMKAIKWCCPKCRKEYDLYDVPKIYECFCKKTADPPNHPWLIPHSCGEICENYLTPDCGHKCRLLCHPGPCPPCPQMLTISCKCNKSPPRSIRCFQKSWSCDMKCSKKLACGIHVCSQRCHEEGNCPPCNKKSKQKCECGDQIAERNCSEQKWHCKKVCGKSLTCGLHKCRKVCHSGDCGNCPLGLPRTCPCGKSQTTAPCSEVIDTCSDTCHKVLACGVHYCIQKCHKGDCGQCFSIIEKKCRCGMHSKELPCSKTFNCETKCKRIRECGKHICNRKCCDGQCSPCDKVCGKTLSCKKHKCKSICHDGPCYPCDLKAQVKCRCGNSTITVPCGRERKTRPPKCSQLCRIPSKCHHQNLHLCHMNNCPPCTQKCGLKNDTTNCDHPCEARCHAAVKVAISEQVQKSANIWQYNYEGYEIKSLPHPQCEVSIEVTCIGGHETVSWPCWNSKPMSCGRVCGRILKCGNHHCQKLCHDKEQECAPCEEACNIPRPTGCVHPCRKPCHLPPCSPCSATIKTNCYCGLTQVIFKCIEFYRNDQNEESLQIIQEKLKCCGNRCIKNYSCGHRCVSNCHAGPCPDPNNCKKKEKIYCECKNLKAEISCKKYRNGLTSLPCDESCYKKKETEDRIKREQEEKIRQIEEEKNRAELELYEKKLGGKKKYRERKQREEIPQKDNKKLLWIVGACSVVIASAAVFIYYMN